MAKNELLIYGAGGLGREVLALVNQLPDWHVAGFVDDAIIAGTMITGVPVKGGAEFLHTLTKTSFVVVAIGDPLVKSQVVNRLTNQHIQYPILVHPTVVLLNQQSIKLGQGSIICAGCVLTTDIEIGNHVLVNLNVSMGHDCRIGNYVSIMPGVNVAGEVQMGDAVLIGSGTTIKNRIQIASRSIVGMGSVVVKNVSEGTTVAGVPARPIIK